MSRGLGDLEIAFAGEVCRRLTRYAVGRVEATTTAAYVWLGLAAETLLIVGMR